MMKSHTLHEESEDIRWFKIPRRYVNRYIPEDMAFDHYEILMDSSNSFEYHLNIVV